MREVSVHQFTWHRPTNVLTAEMSDLAQPLGSRWEPPIEFNVNGEKRTVTYRLCGGETERDNDNDVRWWVLRPVADRYAPIMHIFND